MKTKEHQQMLFNFAYFPNYIAAIEHLADKLADSEEWDFVDAITKNHTILKNYLVNP